MDGSKITRNYLFKILKYRLLISAIDIFIGIVFLIVVTLYITGKIKFALLPVHIIAIVLWGLVTYISIGAFIDYCKGDAIVIRCMSIYITLDGRKSGYHIEYTEFNGNHKTIELGIPEGVKRHSEYTGKNIYLYYTRRTGQFIGIKNAAMQVSSEEMFIF